MKIAHALAGMSLVLIASQSSASTVYGWGNDSCGKWTEAHTRDNDIAAHQDSWLNGFISGFNVLAPPRAPDRPKPDAAAMRGWVSNYCQANPLAPIAEAAFKLAMTLTSP